MHEYEVGHHVGGRMYFGEDILINLVFGQDVTKFLDGSLKF